MSTSALQAHLDSTCKIVDYSDTLLSRNCPDFGSDGCLQFRDSLGIVLVDIIFEITPQIKIWGVEVRRVWGPFRITPPIDETITKAFPQPLQWVIGSMGSCSILLKPLFIPHNTSMSTQGCPKLSLEPPDNALVIVSSAGGVILNGPHTRRTSTPQIFICGVISKTMSTRTIPRLSLNWRQPSLPKSGQFLERSVRVIDNFARRIQVSLQRRGRHLEHIIERQ